MRTTVRAGVFLLGGLLSGCASTGTINENYFSGDPKESGLIVIAYANTGRPRNMLATEVHFRSMDGKVIGSIRNPTFFGRYLLSGEKLPTPRPPDLIITADDPMGGINVLRLPAGNYELYGYSADGETYVGRLTRTIHIDSTPFSEKFTVKPGSITYVGRINFDYYPNVAPRFQTLNKAAEDIAVFKREFEQFRNAEVEVREARALK